VRTPLREDALLVSDTNKKMSELWDSYWTAAPGTKKAP